VGLRPTAVVRLERALAHEVLLRHDIDGATRRWTGTRGAGTTAESRTPAPPEAVPADGTRRRRPQTPTSITETPPPPVTGRIADCSWSPCDAPDGVRTRRGGPDAMVATTRPDHLPERCRAVDRAVSVAVAPRRTTGSRRRADPGGRPAAESRNTPPDLGLDQRIYGREQEREAVRRDRSSTVHTLWTPMWNQSVRGSTTGHPPQCARRAGHPVSGPTGSDRDRMQ
jgi:hypothetical protein